MPVWRQPAEWAKRKSRTTNRPVRGEGAISADKADLVNLIPAWNAASRGADLRVGASVDEGMLRALELRRQLRIAGRPTLDFQDVEVAADVLHATCRSLVEDCLKSPLTTLEDASSILKLVEVSRWTEDVLGEREGLLCSLNFVCWRATRILGLSQEAQRCEREYKRTFRESLQWCVVEEDWGPETRWKSLNSSDLLARGGEDIYQALLYLHYRAESSPEVATASSIALHQLLRAELPRLPSDLQSYFLGCSARIAGAALRILGRLQEASQWLDTAEDDFRGDVDPTPELARVLFQRLTMIYAQSRISLVSQFAPALERTFAGFGMEDDRIKCRIIWAAALKIAGRCEEAISVLEPLQRSRPEIRPELYGWILLHLGDIHQMCGDYERGLKELSEAARFLREGRQFTGLSDVDMIIASACRARGLLTEAVALFKSSQEDYARLGMRSNEAYVRLLIAETYLVMGNPRGAELEARAALPILDEQAIAADAVAAISILREAIRRQKLEPQTLSEVRERFRPKQ